MRCEGTKRLSVSPRKNIESSLLVNGKKMWQIGGFPSQPHLETYRDKHHGRYELENTNKYRLLHRKCDVRIFIHELQDFGKRTSERSERVSFPKSCNE